MLSFFRTNQLFLNVLLLLYLVVMRVSSFIHPIEVAPLEHGILTKWIYTIFPPLSTSAFVLGFLLIFVQGTLINVTMARFRVAAELSLLPGLFYCFFTSMMPDFLPLSSIILGNTFVILALSNLYDTYKSNTVAGRIFDTGLWLGVASLFHFSFIFLVFWGIIGLGILRGIRLKEVFMFLIGLSVPIFLEFVYCFWTNNLPSFSEHFTKNIGLMSVFRYNATDIYLKLGLTVLFLVMTLMASNQFMSRRNMMAQKYISILYWLMLICGITSLIQPGVNLSQLLIISIPIGILLSMTFQRITPAIAEALHLLLVMIALILQFFYLLS
ncbi:MAG: hypothetical protein JNL70_09400 [Saprospiraceae bacterium]|nr:hypothetical protein [Saprospiraceae bacterium]